VCENWGILNGQGFAETTSVWNYLFFVAMAIELHLHLLLLHYVDKNVEMIHFAA
jgi:hypothetical protein